MSLPSLVALPPSLLPFVSRAEESFLAAAGNLSEALAARCRAWLAEHGLLPQGVISLATSSLVAGNLIGNVPFVVLLLGLMPELSHAVLIGLALMTLAAMRPTF